MILLWEFFNSSYSTRYIGNCNQRDIEYDPSGYWCMSDDESFNIFYKIKYQEGRIYRLKITRRKAYRPQWDDKGEYIDNVGSRYKDYIYFFDDNGKINKRIKIKYRQGTQYIKERFTTPGNYQLMYKSFSYEGPKILLDETVAAETGSKYIIIYSTKSDPYKYEDRGFRYKTKDLSQ